MSQYLEITSASEVTTASPAKPLTLRSNVAWTGLGMAVYYAAQYLIIPIIAKVSDAKAVGEYSLGMAIVAPIIIFSQMQFRQVQVTDTSKQYSFSDYFWTRIFCTAAALLVIAVFACFSHYAPLMAVTIVLIGLTEGVESLSDLAYGNIQKYDRMDRVAIAMCCRGVLGTAAFGAVFALTHSLGYAVTSTAIVWAAIFAVYEVPIARRVSGRRESLRMPTISAMRRLVRMGAVLAITSALVSFSCSLPRYYLDRYCGDASVGLYSAAATSLGFMALFAGALSQGTLARASAYYASRDAQALFRLFLKLSGMLVGVGLAFIAALVLVGKPLVSVLFRPSYVSIVVPMIVMALGATVNMLASFAAAILTVARKFNLWLLCTSMIVIIQIPLCQMLIPRYGVIGAAWSEAIRYTVAMVILNVAAIKVFRNHLGDAVVVAR